MRRIAICGLSLCVLMGAQAPALAQESLRDLEARQSALAAPDVEWKGSAPEPAAVDQPPPCKPGPNALGVSRIAEVDTSQGPRFGFQYNEQAILADGEVVLTFDDGPLRAYTRPVLEALAAHCTLATFFLVGRQALADPELVQEYARRGHTIGTHTWSHANLGALAPQKARAEIELGFSAVQAALGKPLAPFFRFPFLNDPKSMIAHVQERHIGIFSIDVDSKDFRTRDPAAVHGKVIADLARTRKGIVLFHDIQPSTARALPGLLAELKAKGYRIVHLRPKASATTVAEFDTQAKDQLDKKRAKVVAQPLARRAITWAAAETEQPPPVAVKAKAEAASAKRATRPVRQPVRPARASGDKNWTAGLWTW
jgi:peptidoglycan/xylan/chitin deacetylase (PgdA/CDA1 family)